MKKTCSKCRREKPYSDFYKSPRGKGGRRAKCISCGNAESRAYRKANPNYWREWTQANSERVAETRRAWLAKNRDREHAYQRKWREANAASQAERHRDYRRNNLAKERGRGRQWAAANADVKRAWRRANPTRLRAYELAHRAGDPTTPDALAFVSILAADGCSYCGSGMDHIDHIEPISGGGDGGWTNLTSACATCNLRKGRKSLLLFLHERRSASYA